MASQAATFSLNFDSASGTVLDRNGVGSGFTARMPGSGGNIAGNDTNLLLRTAQGLLQLRTSPGADFNGQANLANASVVGIDLSDLGYTGEQDFVAKARFVNLTNRNAFPDQLCLVVGTTTSNLIRAGFINFDQYHGGTDANEGTAVNTISGIDSSSRFFGAVVGDTMTVEIRRASGRWYVTVNGFDRLPNANTDGTGAPAQPGFLDSATNLFVGVVAMDVGNNSPWHADLDSFSVNVTPVAPPSVVAYWRFENGPAFSNVPHTGADGVFHGTTPDVSGNGNSLSAWTAGGYAGFAYRTDRPFGLVPQNGNSNLFSIKNTGANPAMFTRASSSLPTGINADTMTPTQFTIEASYKPERNGGYRTIVGRDARNVSTGNGNLAALYLQVRPDDSVGVLFTDVSGYTHSAFSPPGWIYGFEWASDPEGANALVGWYHLAAVSDGDTLKFHVNNQLVAWTDLTISGSPNRALAVGPTSESGYTAGSWSVGRGLYAGGHTDRAYGFIDEVRICNSALMPNQFLTSPRPHLVLTASAGTNLTLTVTRGEPGATCYVLQSTNASLPPSQWTAIAAGAFNASGTFSTTVSKADAQKFFYLRAQLKAPPLGDLRYKLAASENWPANIRAEIMYSMDGAVAEYNRYGTFNKVLTVTYNPGVPTAQAGYGGQIDFGGSRNFRVALHEIGHTLGVGTAPNYGAFIQGGLWIGAHAIAQVRQFDGPGANVNTDGTHFWPYGLNFDNEGGTENLRRHVLMVAALRRDMGIQ
ncbi:MAG TPA: LamG-like jellyroll fold domain-containing protein [Verrucomicrobiae bacterium]|nr:LamG-like jellyroll fold domain-containing protein [Verrucomicrobiae bacterium]